MVARDLTENFDVHSNTSRYNRAVDNASHSSEFQALLEGNVVGRPLKSYLKAAVCAIVVGEKSGQCNIVVGKQNPIIAVARIQKSDMGIMRGREIEMQTIEGLSLTAGFYSTSDNNVFIAVSWDDHRGGPPRQIAFQKIEDTFFRIDNQISALS